MSTIINQFPYRTRFPFFFKACSLKIYNNKDSEIITTIKEKEKKRKSIPVDQNKAGKIFLSNSRA